MTSKEGKMWPREVPIEQYLERIGMSDDEIKEYLRQQRIRDLEKRIEEKNVGFHQKVERPNWIEYFMGLAFCISQRSLDGQTKHGAIITDKDNRILATGYNSFPSKISDSVFPNLRPNKYKFMRHAEQNALQNCPHNLHSYEGLICYVTGKPCLSCLFSLGESNVKTIYAYDRQGSVLEKGEEDEHELYILQKRIQYEVVKPSLEWLDNEF